MSSKAEIQTQIAILRHQMEELEKEINYCAPYKEYVKEQMAIQKLIINNSGDEAIRNVAWMDYEFHCGKLEEALKKEREREERMRELRDAERTLSMSLESAE
ncbi:hypothetical protein FMEXI_4423 [Fusarium mexicanum]|uniref:Uncharacterized protein n=1 Tax=Fusarium mexicanum TaxID=751941 RepID=A0A8H5N0H6_9HYPO|nr:hypothetical protein FMEXI_4423 [Fusarium mexicanum]